MHYYNLLSLQIKTQIKTNKLGGAEKTIKEIKQKNIETAGIYRLTGDFYRIKKKHKEAIEAYDKSLSMRKKIVTYYNKATLLYNLGAEMYEAGNLTEGTNHIERALNVVKKGLQNCSSNDVNYINLSNFGKRIEKRLNVLKH